VIEGEAGIGKTALLQAARERARGADLAVLHARASEMERDFGFGVVRQLFEPVTRGPMAPRALAGPARLAAPVVGVEVQEQHAAKPPLDAVFPAVHGLYWMVANLAEAQPLALLVDDVHWADRASLRFLAYLAPRLAEQPVLLLATTRPGEEAERLHHALGRPALLEPQRLSEAATATVVRALYPDAAPDVCRTCHAATGGNVFFVREVAAAIRDGDGDGNGDRGLRDWSPERVTRAVAGRIAVLDAPAREVARASAILGDGASVHGIATLAGLADDAARDALDALRAGGVLAAGPRVEFLHPIVRTAVEASIPVGTRAGGHARAARLEAAMGAAPERIAAHLLAADPAGDPWVCEQLRLAARQASARGAPEGAARYLERALAEPPPEEDRSALLVELGAASAFAFRPGAAGFVRRGFELAAPGSEERLEAALLHAHLSLQAGRGAEALEPLTQVLAESSADSTRALMIEGFVANLTRAQLSARVAARPIISRLLAREGITVDADPSALIALAAELAMAAEERERAAALAAAGLRRIAEIPPLARAFATLTATRALIVADQDAQAREVLEGAMDGARASGALFDFVYHAVSHANLSYRAGQLFESENDARSGYELALAGRWRLGLPSITNYLAQALIARGELAEAREVLRASRLDGPPGDLTDVYTANPLLLTRARLSLAEGDRRAALAELVELRARQDAFGERNPSLAPWRSELALVLAGGDEHEEAVRLADEEVALARRWGAPRAIGVALRAAGSVRGAAEGRVCLEEAVTVLAGSFARLEYARALADLGELRLHDGAPAAARTLLREALELAHGCGAAPLEDRVRELLRATGARPRRAARSGPAALTPSERRVCELAAAGLSNRDICERLFVTVRTVEFHLNNAFRKLGIDARSKLADALIQERPTH